MKLQSPPQAMASFTALSVLLILSFIYLREHHPSLWNLSLAFAFATAAALVFQRFRLSLFLFRSGRSQPLLSITGDAAGDLENQIILKGYEKPAKVIDVKSYRNGCSYEGEFYKGKWDGSGVFNFTGKGMYAGDWVCGNYDGYGTETLPSGNVYEGRFLRGHRHGFGVHKCHNGDVYAGEWKEGVRHGRGVQRFCDGSRFVGEFVGGDKHGLGDQHFRNGDLYRGQYFGDIIHGFGVYSCANGRRYEGSWHRGRRHGFGAYTVGNGEAMSGEWDCGNLKNHLPLTDSNVQIAVQSARKASDQSLLLPRDEGKARTAVAMAQRAASVARMAAAKAVHNQKYGVLWNLPEDRKFSLPL